MKKFILLILFFFLGFSSVVSAMDNVYPNGLTRDTIFQYKSTQKFADFYFTYNPLNTLFAPYQPYSTNGKSAWVFPSNSIAGADSGSPSEPLIFNMKFIEAQFGLSNFGQVEPTAYVCPSLGWNYSGSIGGQSNIFLVPQDEYLLGDLSHAYTLEKTGYMPSPFPQTTVPRPSSTDNTCPYLLEKIAGWGTSGYNIYGQPSTWVDSIPDGDYVLVVSLTGQEAPTGGGNAINYEVLGSNIPAYNYVVWDSSTVPDTFTSFADGSGNYYPTTANKVTQPDFYFGINYGGNVDPLPDPVPSCSSWDIICVTKAGFESLVTWFSNLYNSIVDGFNSIVTGLWNIFGSIATDIGQAISASFDNFLIGLGNMFLPTDESLQQFSNLVSFDTPGDSLIATKFPFSYIFDIGNVFNELFSNSGSNTYTVSVNTGALGTITFISPTLIQNVPYASTIKTILGYLLYFMLAYSLYHLLLRSHSKEHATV